MLHQGVHNIHRPMAPSCWQCRSLAHEMTLDVIPRIIPFVLVERQSLKQPLSFWPCFSIRSRPPAILLVVLSTTVGAVKYSTVHNTVPLFAVLFTFYPSSAIIWVKSTTNSSINKQIIMETPKQHCTSPSHRINK